MRRQTVGVDEAMNKLSQLLARVEAGEIIGLTRHGKEIALLVPVDQNRLGAKRAIARLRQLRKGSRLNGLSIKDLRDTGRP